MGNSQSHSQRHLHASHTDTVAIVSVTPHRVKLNKKMSRANLATKLSCISGWSSQESLPSTSTSTSASDEKRCLSEDSLSFRHDRDDATPAEQAPDEHAAAYASFLDAYPEYRQTWLIDSLRRSDFSRLIRSGETYVDYMGGSLYPESLVHVHADFLSRSILGNTHSVNNRLDLPFSPPYHHLSSYSLRYSQLFLFTAHRCHLRLLPKHVRLSSPFSTLPPDTLSFLPPMRVQRLSLSESRIRSDQEALSFWVPILITVSMAYVRLLPRVAQRYAIFARKGMAAYISGKLRCVALHLLN